MKSSLLVATYNWPDALELCLLSALNQTVEAFEIVIADDGSTEDTRELIERLQKTTTLPIRHVWHEDKGYRKTIVLNKALAQTQGDYIIQIDGDIILDSHFVEDHQRYSKRGIYCAGSRTLLDAELTNTVQAEKRFTIRPFERGIRRRWSGIRLLWLAPFICGDALRHDNIRSCNISYWRDDLIAANGFNEEICGWGCEDKELAARLTVAGIRRRKVKFAAVQHHLNHAKESRDRLEVNDAILTKTVEDHLLRCKIGVDQYL